MEKTVDIIIPVYKPNNIIFVQLMERLKRQTYPIHKIILMNTEKQYWQEELIGGCDLVEVHHLSRAEFDHGGTRRRAAELSHSDVMIFMTQDAIPHGDGMVEELMKSLDQEEVKAAYARQLPREDCSVLERYIRSFNYPETSQVKSAQDLPKMGIKTFFCSNVCAAYEKETYNKLGGFPSKTIFNEDMIYASKVIHSGYKIAYCGEATVVHSHNYNCRQQFHRNFDLAVSQAEFPEAFQGISSEGEGIRMVKQVAAYVLSIHRPGLLFPLFFQSAAKYIGYFLGRRYKALPKGVIYRCTMNREYWTFEK